jgi:hypothetical protein
MQFIRKILRSAGPVPEIGLGVILAICLGLATLHLEWIWSHVGEHTLIALTIFVAILLYAVRETFRIAYGFLEILVGLFAIFGTMSRANDAMISNQSYVQIAAGIYIIVRGIDNFMHAEPFSQLIPALRELKKVWFEKGSP